MRAAIIQCDAVVPELAQTFGDYPEMIVRMFRETRIDVQFDVFDARTGRYPENLDGYDFFITTGSKAAAYDTDDWIRQLIEFIRKLDSQERRLIGICFGHQLIALARNGSVERSPKGWGVGVASNRLTTTPDWMEESTQTLNIIASHQDQVSTLPADARVIAASDFCPYFVVQWNDHFLSIQGHPEWHTDYSRALMNLRRDKIGDARVEAGLSSLATETDNRLFTRWILEFVSR